MSGPKPVQRSRRQSVLIVVGCLALLTAILYFLVYPEWQATRHWQQAQQALDQFDLPAACEHLQHYIQVHPGSAKGQFLLARTLRRQDEYSQAAEHLEKAAQLDWVPEAIALERQLQQAQQMGVQSPAGEQLKGYAYTKHPSEKLILEALFKGDRAALNLRQARVWLDVWIDHYPNDWPPRFWRGELLKSFALFEQARADYQRVLELKPDHAETLLHLGLLALANRGKFAEAQNYLEKYLQVVPDSPEALLALARCQKDQGQSEAAVATVRRLLEKQPEHAEAAAMLGAIETERGDYNAALTWLKRAEAAGAEARTTAYQLSQVLRRLHRDDEAAVYEQKFKKIDALKDALDRNILKVLQEPHNAALRQEIGQQQRELGRTEQAIRWFLSALGEDPRFQAAHLALAECYEQKGDLESVRLATLHRRQAADTRSTPPTPAPR